MNNTVIIVGAGATLAEALPSHPNRKETPPLDSTFFMHCENANYMNRKQIREFMEENYGMNPFSGSYGMEEVFNYIYADVFSAKKPDEECLAAYWALLRMYRRAIGNTTNRLKCTSRYGVGDVIKTIFNHDHSKNLSIVTFNQDLVIEKSLESIKNTRKYEDIPWDFTKAYGINFSKVTKIKDGTTYFTSTSRKSIKVLKLHGSLNWVYRVKSGSDPENSLIKPDDGLIAINDKNILVNLSVRSQDKSRKRDALIPLIVPPIYEKSGFYKDKLAPLWNTAKKKLKNASELVIFGYSFPDADFGAKSALRQCLHKSGIEKVHIIDSNPLVAGKIGNLLGGRSFHYYPDAPTFKKIYQEEH